MERHDVIIVGSGPGGSAVALGLAARDPDLASRTLLLEKSHHPRDKTCAGGVIPKAVHVLERLGIGLDVPRVTVDHAGIAVPGARVTIDEPGLCHVVRRREFDARLAWAARDRGVALREGEHVTHIARDGDGVRVETTTRAYWAPVVVGADGSGSLVRRALVPGAAGIVGRALMCDVPVDGTRWDGWAARRYEFDFTSCPSGFRGYRWTFPCVIDGVPHANVGVYALPPTDGAMLKRELRAELERIGGAAAEWKAFPIRTWAAASALVAPRALLVGDAAGVDPLMGEGISFALEHGLLAADAIIDARERADWSFRGYARAVARGPIGRKLRYLGLGTRLFYGRGQRLWFRLAAASPRAQAFGLAWYNGVDGRDERSPLVAIGRLLARRRPVVRPPAL